ncbi:MAG: lysophospholipase [Bacteroidales bacterium]|nr:lysophospholipase [Bacteroidales bacterium]MBQ4476952.1 lysophospholipase [Bacteroidales bacterium]MBR3798449.1 lysophospholipase [Bacteroidales bacterium]MBR6066555.1 lysophospholipase [Bacteroidales bacterium]
MRNSEHTFKSADGADIFYRRFLPDGETKAVLQIFHGMAEHSARYADFANYLTDNGIAVYVSDHRGHGKTITDMKDYGVWPHRDEWWRIVADLKQLKDIATAENPNVPYFVLGHSMGSFLARTFITRYSTEISGVIISGTGTNPTAVLRFGKFIADFACTFEGCRSKAKLLDKLSFGGYNKGYSAPYQWLSRDDSQVKKYIADELCGGLFSNSFYRGFFKGLIYINKRSSGELINKNLKMLFVSGDKDPVGNCGKGVEEAVDFYRDLHIANIQLKLYPNARHEILNEINKEEVYNDLLKWINSVR